MRLSDRIGRKKPQQKPFKHLPTGVVSIDSDTAIYALVKRAYRKLRAGISVYPVKSLCEIEGCTLKPEYFVFRGGGLIVCKGHVT